MGVSSTATPSREIGSVSVTAGSKASVSWSGLVAEHEAYLEEKRDKSLVFVGDGYENDGEIMSVPYTHRWTREYTERQYAQMHDFIRGAMDEYENPYIAIFPALTASTTDARGEYRPPLDHFQQLKRSWGRGVRYELHEVMEADRQKDTYPARDWEYLQVWEPTTDAGYTEGGYAHCHPVVVCDGKVETERFRSVMAKHVEKCEWAKAAAHDVNEIDIRPLDDLANPAAYLFKYLSKSWGGDPEPYQRRFDALLHETGYRRFQPSDGAQRWMECEESEAAEPWLFAGVAEPTQIETLQEYEDAEEFRIEHEMGVGSYLSGYGKPSGVAVDEDEGIRERCDHETWHRGQCVGCGMTERQLILYGSKDGPPG